MKREQAESELQFPLVFLSVIHPVPQLSIPPLGQRLLKDLGQSIVVVVICRSSFFSWGILIIEYILLLCKNLSDSCTLPVSISSFL